jgi:uncharacterized protein (DUF1501 family)
MLKLTRTTVVCCVTHGTVGTVTDERHSAVANCRGYNSQPFGGSLGSNGDGADHAWGAGQMVPTTATDQYGAELAKWCGIPAASLPSPFPSLPNFPGALPGFLG